jgi:hypothetical protein
MCEISNQLALNANADNQSDAIQSFNERAVDELIVNGLGESAFGEILLDDVLIAVSENELIIPILNKLVTGDLTAISELRLLTKGCANERIQDLADSISH